MLLNFLRESLNVDPVEIELERRVKVGELRGRIDALFRHIIIEVKTEFEGERDDAQRELKKYFASLIVTKLQHTTSLPPWPFADETPGVLGRGSGTAAQE